MITQLVGGRKFAGLILMTAVGVGVHLGTTKGLTTELTILMLTLYSVFTGANLKEALSVVKGEAVTGESPASEELINLQASVTQTHETVQELASRQPDGAAVAALEALNRIESGVALQNQTLAAILQRGAK